MNQRMRLHEPATIHATAVPEGVKLERMGQAFSADTKGHSFGFTENACLILLLKDTCLKMMISFVEYMGCCACYGLLRNPMGSDHLLT